MTPVFGSFFPDDLCDVGDVIDGGVRACISPFLLDCLCKKKVHCRE